MEPVLKMTIEGQPGAGKSRLAKELAIYLTGFHVTLIEEDIHQTDYRKELPRHLIIITKQTE